MCYTRFLLLLLSPSLFLGCSFNYTQEAESTDKIPGITIEEATVTRYEGSVKSVVFTIQILEMYDTDRIWAGEGVSFTQFSKKDSEQIEAIGEAGLILVNDEDDVYFLGEGVKFDLLKDSIFLSASDMRWSKAQNVLTSPRNGTVELRKEDGSSIQGTGFFADTLARSYVFESSVSGQFVNEGKE